MFRFGFKSGRGRLPRQGLLIYLARPNSDEYLIGEDTEIGEDTYIWGYILPDDSDIRSATGWVNGTANVFYTADGVPIVALATEIAVAILPSNVVFSLVDATTQTGKLAIYTDTTTEVTLDKARSVLRDESINRLFYGVNGIWYDPQDLTTMYQDASGTPPVYRPGTGLVDPPVGLMLDKSGGEHHASQNTTLARPTLSGRYNLLTNSLTGFVISGSTPFTITQPGITAPTGENAVAYTNTSVSTTGNLMIFPGTPCPSAPLVYTMYIHNSSTRRIFSLSVYNQTKNSSVLPSNTFNIDTKAVSGGNLVANEMENGWYKLTLSIDNYSGIANGDLINTYITTGFGPGGMVVFGGADLRVKRDGSSLPAYQSVTNANTYDTAGFPLFLKRDKVDDDLIVQAPAITGQTVWGSIDTVDIAAATIVAGEYKPFGAIAAGEPTCTQWIAIGGTLTSSEQAVLERYVYSKSKLLVGV